MPKAFISYSTKDKLHGAVAKRLLEPYSIDCFLAHEDLQVSEEWQARILEELCTCHIFIPLLSQYFRSSDWAPQEIGVIAARKGVIVIPLSLDGTMPFGFISHLQGKRISPVGITEDLLLPPIMRKDPHQVFPGMIKNVANAGSFRGAEAALGPLAPFFSQLNDSELDELVSASIENSQVWSASKCRGTFLPALIAVTRDRIAPQKLKALEYQLEHDNWYVPTEA